MLRQDLFGHFADQRETGAEAVVALGLVEGLEQFGLLNAHEVARFPFDVPDLHVRQQLERGAVAVFQAARASGYTTHASRSTAQKTDQAIGLTQREGLQDDGFRFAGRHAQCRRADRAAGEAL